VWDEYVAMLEEYPEDMRHQRIHAGHNTWLEPEEERFDTPELLDATCLVGTADELVTRLRALGKAGLSEVIVLPGRDVKDEVVRRVAQDVLPHLHA
jgi:alkanesulfonate monooxygenase SsuD/methylene tetrahydromethanopterin reductase-like flavin-dependent oxidoreductase (luciferase family)